MENNSFIDEFKAFVENLEVMTVVTGSASFCIYEPKELNNKLTKIFGPILNTTISVTKYFNGGDGIIEEFSKLSDNRIDFVFYGIGCSLEISKDYDRTFVVFRNIKHNYYLIAKRESGLKYIADLEILKDVHYQSDYEDKIFTGMPFLDYGSIRLQPLSESIWFMKGYDKIDDIPKSNIKKISEDFDEGLFIQKIFFDFKDNVIDINIHMTKSNPLV